MRDFRSLDVWKKSHQLALRVYKATVAFPKDELYGLTSQTRRSSSSIPANIAKGCGSDSEPELARYLLMAMKSASELEYHLILARDLDYLSNEEHLVLERDVIEVKKMLASLVRKLRPRPEYT